MDIWDKEKRSKVMAKIKSKDTKPEILVRRFLYARGYRYRKNVKGLPGTPDIVLRKYGIVIFIHGCFWHGHEVDGHIPRSNSEFWRAKIERNQKRDARDKEALKSLGWKIMTVWECQLKPAVREETLNSIVNLIDRSYLDQCRIKNPVPYPIAEDGYPYNMVAEDMDEYHTGDKNKL